MSNYGSTSRVYSQSDLQGLSDENLYSALKRADENISKLREKLRGNSKDSSLISHLRDAEVEHCYLKRELEFRRGRREAHAKYITDLSRKKRAERSSRESRGGDRRHRENAGGYRKQYTSR